MCWRHREFFIVGALLAFYIFTLPMLTQGSKKNKYYSPVLTGPYLGQKPPGEKPEVFSPGIISTFMREGNVVVTPDGKEIFYNVYTPKEGKERELVGTIVTVREKNGIWTTPQVASFSGWDDDDYLTMHPDGKIIYFNSNRKPNRKALTDEWNIWYVEKTVNGWGDARPLDPPINGNGNVSCFSVSKNNNAYFTKMNDKWQKIFRSKYIDGQYQEPEELPKNVNSTKTQFDSYISPNEDYIIVPVYDREDSLGATDLYVSFRDKKDNWSPLINLGPQVNTENNDGSATISSDGKYIFISTFLECKKSRKLPRTYDDLVRSHARPVTSHGLIHYIPEIYWFNARYLDKIKPEEFK